MNTWLKSWIKYNIYTHVHCNYSATVTRCASIDIGQKNLCLCIEEFDKSKLKFERPRNPYNCDGTPTAEMERCLHKVYMNGKILLHINFDASTGCRQTSVCDRMLLNIIDFFNTHSALLQTCEYIIIEKQMKINTPAMKIMQHCHSYFIYTYRLDKCIIIFSATHKTQVLGSKKIKIKNPRKGRKKYKTVSKYKRKKWSVAKAIEILTMRTDTTYMKNMSESKKKDDLADTLTQLQAFKYRTFTIVPRKRYALQRLF